MEDELQTKLFLLRKEQRKKQEELTTLNKNISQAQQKHQERLEELATLLNVEAEAEKINAAVTSRQTKQNELDTEINQKSASLRTLQRTTQELEYKKQSLEGEIQERLQIKDYATELEAGIAFQQSQKAFLEKEVSEKQERLALADALTEFLTRNSIYDFNRICSHIESIKKLREESTHPFGFLLPVIKEETRSLALKVFEGDLVSQAEHRELLQRYQDLKKEKRELETKAAELETKYEEIKGNFEHVKREQQLLEAIKANFEAHPTNLAEIKNWVLWNFNSEIEKRVDERFNAYAAGTYGLLDFVAKKITDTFSNQQKGQQ
jgi:peptidoglycan hydrolase CwlO-like protein